MYNYVEGNRWGIIHWFPYPSCLDDYNLEQRHRSYISTNPIGGEGRYCTCTLNRYKFTGVEGEAFPVPEQLKALQLDQRRFGEYRLGKAITIANTGPQIDGEQLLNLGRGIQISQPGGIFDSRPILLQVEGIRAAFPKEIYGRFMYRWCQARDGGVLEGLNQEMGDWLKVRKVHCRRNWKEDRVDGCERIYTCIKVVVGETNASTRGSEFLHPQIPRRSIDLSFFRILSLNPLLIPQTSTT